MRVLLNIWSPFLLSHVGDFACNHDFWLLRNQYPELEFLTPPLLATVVANAKYSFQKVSERLPWNHFGLVPLKYWLYFKRLSYLPPSCIDKINADVILSYGSDPWPFHSCRAGRVQYSHVASKTLYKRAGLLKQLSAEIEAKRWVLRTADVVICRDPASMQRVKNLLGISDSQLRCIPHYEPYTEAISEDKALHKQEQQSNLSILFVGGESRRKGLVNLLKAWTRLSENLRRSVTLTVVSDFKDGRVSSIPEDVRVLNTRLGREEMYSLMEETHIFVLPTLYDSYGRVVVEAMAKGCCVISSRQDPQDWMLDYGEAGLLVDPESVQEIALALENAICNTQLRQQLALQARERFLKTFYHLVVGKRLYEAFCHAADHRRGS